jgi:hypothetical protein
MLGVEISVNKGNFKSERKKNLKLNLEDVKRFNID